MELSNVAHEDGITFRFAGRDDVPAIVALLADDVLGKTREVAGNQELDRYLQAFDDMAAQGGNQYLLAINEPGDIVGCVQITIIPGLSRSGNKRAQLEGVRVAGTARGLNIGTRMIREAHAIAANEGCGLVQLTTDRQRDDALRFYEELGYQNSHNGMKLNLDERQ
jgi:ribosomal protein S18 acetylase RimI-like enzyme